MRILVLQSSGRVRGNTSRVAECAVEALRSEALLLATTGSTPGKHALRSMQVPLWTWGYRISASAWFATGAAMPAEDIRRRHGARIAAAARRLFSDIHERRVLQPSFVSLLVFRIQQGGWSKAAPGSLDYAYWRDHGWLDLRRSTFFFQHHANPFKTRVARIIGAAAAAFAT